MATSPAQSSAALPISMDDKVMILAGLKVLRAQYQRAANSESDATIKAIRSDAVLKVDSLAARVMSQSLAF